jgi:hypothetical protein
VFGFRNPTLIGQAHLVSVWAVDRFDNAVAGYGGTVALTSSDPAALLPAHYTFTPRDAGKHAFLVTLRTAGLRSIMATDTANASLTGSEANISVGTMTAAVAGPAVGARGQPLTFTLTAAETNQPAGTPFTFAIDSDGNGTTDQKVVGPSGTQVSHAYPASSPAAGFSVKVRAVDPAGNASQAPARAVQVLAAVTEPDPQDPHLTALAVGGTAGNDAIVVRPAGAGQVEVLIGGVSQGTFAPTGHLLIYGQAGNDAITVQAGVAVAVPGRHRGARGAGPGR